MAGDDVGRGAPGLSVSRTMTVFALRCCRAVVVDDDIAMCGRPREPEVCWVANPPAGAGSRYLTALWMCHPCVLRERSAAGAASTVLASALLAMPDG